MSDIKDDDIRDILKNIRENGSRNDYIREDEPSRAWSHDDIDRLLEQTERTKENEESVLSQKNKEITADSGNIKSAVALKTADTTKEKRPEIDISSGSVSSEDTDRLKSILNNERNEKNRLDSDKISVYAKGKLSNIFAGLKKEGKKIVSSMKSIEDDADEKRFLLSDDDDDFDDDTFDTEPENMIIAQTPVEISDNKTKMFSSVDNTQEIQTVQEDTVKVYIEKPGIVLKKGETEEGSDLEGAPIIMSADDALNEKRTYDFGDNHTDTDEDVLKDRTSEAVMEGQIVFHGFEGEEEKPEQIDESEAEQALFEKRREKIRKFTLFGDEEGADPYGSEDDGEKIGELFDTPESRPQRKEAEKFLGVEYMQTKDSRRVMRYLISQKKKSANKLITLGILLLSALIIGISSAAKTTVAGDRILTIFSNFIVFALALVVSNQTIVGSLEMIKRKKVNINSAISLASIICFFQNLLMLILYFFDKNTVSVFSGAGIGLLLLGELNNYVTYARTIDSMRMCSGDNKDRLYSIEGISDDKDAVELGKNVKSSSPRIRFSCKTRFPSHLIELCTSETSADKMTKLILPAIVIFSLINLAVSWAVQGDFATGFAAFTVTMILSVPAYGALLIQLPLRWTNNRFNRNGGMISCQEATEELCRTNAIIIDSKELFDQNACAMLGFKDFKNVRVDDAMLYAAAMVIRSGGPLTGVFDQMVINRRDILPTVKSFSYEEKLGVSGWIYGQKVVLGNRAMMTNHNVQIPQTVDEDRYLMSGHEVMFLAIAHKLAAMIVVDYAPNVKIAPYLKKLRDAGVSILVRNCDSNVTERMVSGCYDMRLDNIKIINSSAGRVFKKYKSRPKMAARASSIHDGTPYSFMCSLCTASTLRHVFKFSNMLTAVGIIMGFAIVLLLSILSVISDLPAIFVILTQLLIAAAFAGVIRIVCSK